MAKAKTYYCVAAVHRGRVSGWYSCSTVLQRAQAHLAALQDRGMKNMEIVERGSKPRGVNAPPRGRRRPQGALFVKSPAKGGQRSLF